MKRLLTILLVLCILSPAVGQVSTRGTYDPGALRTDGSNAADLVELKNASFTGDIDVTGDVGAVNASFTGKLQVVEPTTTNPSGSFLSYTSGYFKVGSFYLSAAATEYKLHTLLKSTSLIAGKLTFVTSRAAREAADFHLPVASGASASAIIWQSSENIFKNSDVAGKISVYRSTSSEWVIKNNTGGSMNIYYTALCSGNGSE